MKNKNIHFIGICGVAMSAVALAFKRQGWTVTGSDVGFYPPISTYLKDSGVDYYPGWHPDRVLKTFRDGGKDGNLVVVGNVASSHNPEWLYVQDHQLNYKSYPEIIQEFFIKRNSIVCAGTYGKSTTTTLMTWILQQAKYDPSYMFGGLSLNDLPAADLTDGKWSVVEGDEYKASRWDSGPKFAYYSPTHLLLTAIVWDHADVYPTEPAYFATFKKLTDSIPASGMKIISEQAAKVLNLDTKKIITYGQGKNNTYRYQNISQDKQGLRFEIVHEGKTYKVASNCLGDYMADNITGCFALANEIGIAPEKIITAIKSFAGMKRRLEKRFEGAITIFDDIAHSPVKAKSVLETLKKIYGTKIVAVFEPNTGNRRPQAAPWYDNAFAAADEVIIPHLTKIKTNPHEDLPLEGDQLATIISKTHSNTHYISDDSEVVTTLRKQPKNSVIVFLGSHGFRGMIEDLINQLQ